MNLQLDIDLKKKIVKQLLKEKSTELLKEGIMMKIIKKTSNMYLKHTLSSLSCLENQESYLNFIWQKELHTG